MNPVMMNREPEACVLIRLACERCGPVRMALATSPDDPNIECPYCGHVSKFDLLGSGKTIRLLPYFELEANLQQIGQTTPGGAQGFRRIVQGQIVVLCEETSILHFAMVETVWTNAVNISPAGIPSISFKIRGLDTGPIPHLSGCDNCPPFWCFTDEMRSAAKELGALAPKQKKAAGTRK